jgi:hypothetical protein
MCFLNRLPVPSIFPAKDCELNFQVDLDPSDSITGLTVFEEAVCLESAWNGLAMGRRILSRLNPSAAIREAEAISRSYN